MHSGGHSVPGGLYRQDKDTEGQVGEADGEDEGCRDEGSDPGGCQDAGDEDRVGEDAEQGEEEGAEANRRGVGKDDGLVVWQVHSAGPGPRLVPTGGAFLPAGGQAAGHGAAGG